MVAVYGTDGAHVFRRAKGVMDRLLHELGGEAEVARGSDVPYLHPGRSGFLVVGESVVGVIGEIAPEYAERFGIDTRLTIVDLNLDCLLPLLSRTKKYHPIPTFQDTVRDVSFVVAERTTYAEIVAAMQEVDPLIEDVSFLDVYQGKGIELGKKSMAFRLTLRAEDRTLSSEEADGVIKKVTEMLQKKFSATIR